jgi:lipoprotein Spr
MMRTVKRNPHLWESLSFFSTFAATPIENPKTIHMVRLVTTAFSLLFSLAAALPAAAQKRGHTSGTASVKSSLKFLDAIQVSAVDGAPVAVSSIPVPETSKVERQAAPAPALIVLESNAIETVTSLQLKYAVLLDTEVEQVQNTALFSAVDEWFGTRYVLGGSTKEGIDCSAFVQAIYAKLFQIPMPRTVKEQYKAVRQISQTALKEGDLLFFKTRGSSVSHVGIYLQNNKFVHAATSGGVMVSDLFEAYWVRHFAGVGRYDAAPQALALTVNP